MAGYVAQRRASLLARSLLSKHVSRSLQRLYLRKRAEAIEQALANLEERQEILRVAVAVACGRSETALFARPGPQPSPCFD